MALVSPRALVVAMGDKDELFSYKSTMEICEKASAFFREFNKQENLKLCIFEGTHEAENSEEEIEFLFANLK